MAITVCSTLRRSDEAGAARSSDACRKKGRWIDGSQPGYDGERRPVLQAARRLACPHLTA
jgi:hypothetical protein